MDSASRLDSADFCLRLEYLSRTFERESLSPMQLLSRGVEHGLTSPAKDPAQVAADHVMALAFSRPIDTASEDLLSLCEHYSALAEMVTWLLRTGKPWERPDPIMLGKHLWQPNSYLAPNGLRRLVFVDRWSDERAIAESFDWATLESEVYDLPMTLVVVVLGASRDGKRHGPLSKGWLHPQSRGLRFRKRDQSDFGSAWDVVFRENFHDDKEVWLEAMVEDGVLEDHLILHPVERSRNRDQVLSLVESKLSILQGTLVLPEPQLSQCFSPLRKCPFNSECPNFRLPSESTGFIRL